MMQYSTHIFAAQVQKPVELPYLLYVPDPEVPTPWPLILFLHGSGERGNDLVHLSDRGLPKELASGRKIPFLVVVPQCPINTIWSVHMDAILALIDYLQGSYPVDPRRASVTGMSMGGSATWYLAVTYPSRFAAIAPVCGDDSWCVGDVNQVSAIRHMPVWAFHGEQDAVIPIGISQSLVDALRECGSNVQFTAYRDVGHSCWHQAYSTTALYEWLLQQRST